MKIHAATACLPGYDIEQAASIIHTGLREPGLGEISTDHIQLCPQNTGEIDEAMCDRLRQAYPDTAFRLHANARIWNRHVRYDASTFHDDAKQYFRDMADRSRRLNAPAYSLHAGFRRNCTFQVMLDNVAKIQDIFGDIPVAIEGLYRNDRLPQLMDSWVEYEAAMKAGCLLAIDLSHTKILTETEGDSEVLDALLASPNTIEIHLSENDGRSDQHTIIKRKPAWWDRLLTANSNAIVFTEGNQVRAGAFKKSHHFNRSQHND